MPTPICYGEAEKQQPLVQNLATSFGVEVSCATVAIQDDAIVFSAPVDPTGLDDILDQVIVRETGCEYIESNFDKVRSYRAPRECRVNPEKFARAKAEIEKFRGLGSKEKGKEAEMSGIRKLAKAIRNLF